MFTAGPLLLLAATLTAPAPLKPPAQWIGVTVCCKSGSPETYRRNPDVTFDLSSVNLRYLDFRVVDEQGDFIAVQHDDTVFWLKKEAALRPREAVNYYTDIIDKQPTNERAISCRCWAYLALHEYDRALKDAEEAVRLNPESPAWLNNRGEVFLKMKDYNKAINAFTGVIAVTPAYFYARYNRGECYVRTRQFAKAKSDIEFALKSNPNVPGLHMNLARILATAPDDKLRDGKKAVAAAQKAIDMLRYRDGRYFDTLAAAQAEAGDFDKAVAAQQKAFDDLDFMKDDGDAARRRLQLYRDQKPFRDEP